jgi:hypothetical protein
MASYVDKLDRIKRLLDKAKLDPRRKSKYIYNEATMNFNPPWTKTQVNDYLRNNRLPEIH